MVTIKEVAKLAGVSHGTVSNVINGATNVSVNKIQRVKAAMEELGYKPNSMARNLKMEHTKEISMIMPNSRNKEYMEIFEYLNRCATQAGYFVNLRVTNEVPTEERRLLNEALMRNVEGVVLITCQPENETFFDQIIQNGLKIVFVHHEASGGKYNFAGFDTKNVIYERITELVNEGISRIAVITGPKEYTFEADILNNFFVALCELGIPVEPSYVESSNFEVGGVFRSAMRILHLDKAPEAILLSNVGMYSSVKKAMDLICADGEKKPKIIVLQPYDWTSYIEGSSITLPFYRLADAAFSMVMNLIENSETVVRRQIIKVESDKFKHTHEIKGKKDGTLRILLNESPSSNAVKLLLPDFEKKTGIHVIIETKPYVELFDEIWKNRKTDAYDIYSIDLPWLRDLVDLGILRNLNNLYEDSREYFACYTEDVLAKSAKVDDSYYGVPYSLTVQLLFYRKDLFAKLENQRLYYEWYKENLKVPSTWEEFNKVAKLFTRKYNPISDTEYGVTLGGKKHSGAVNEYLARMFEFGGNVFKDKKVAIAQKEAVNALKNYLESYNYANPKAKDWWWDEQVKEYCAGNAAMMVMYTEHVSPLEDRKFSKVVGKTNAAVLPGKYSVLGGWSLGINGLSKNAEEAYEFVKWLSSYELLGPNAVLGRVLPGNREDYKAMIMNVYSWYDTAWEGYAHTKPRAVPRIGGKMPMTEVQMEEIVGNAVHNVVIGECTVNQALERAKFELNEFLGK
jgi:DNA-binding LacI/PurR family transcriptional regulator/ABC-type glycerol-3-phosphate transport system substrate-binding protein